MVGIYKITSPTNKVYIGQSWDLEKRFNTYQKWATKNQRLLYRSFQKHGVENHKFEITHELPSDIMQDVLDTYEQLYIDLYKDCGVVMLNIRDAGNCGRHSEETKELIAATKRGLVMSDEQKLKRSLKLKGKVFSAERNRKVSESRMGIVFTKEHRDNISKAAKIAQKGEGNSRAKLTEEQVKQIRTTYVPGMSRTGRLSLRELAKQFGISKTVLHSVVTGKLWSHVA